jgi:hypothetical protein
MGIRNSAPSLAMALLMISLLGSGVLSVAQSIELHAKDKATPADIGLPGYPGATLYKTPDNDATFDLGYTFGDSHFRLLAANYTSSDTPEQILSFYRKPLSKYGEVLECSNGKPVGKLTRTQGGLTCSDNQKGTIEVNGTSSSKDHELRAGNPQEFRIVGIDKSETKATHFALVFVQLPRDNDKKSK